MQKGWAGAGNIREIENIVVWVIGSDGGDYHMDSAAVTGALSQKVDQDSVTVDTAFLFETGQKMATIVHAYELYDYITHTLRTYCHAAVTGLARSTEDKLIGQIMSVDAASVILSKAIAVMGRGLRGAPIAVPMVFRKGPGFSSALWDEAIFLSADEPADGSISRGSNRNLGKLFGLGRVYGFPFRYDGKLYVTAGVILSEGQTLTPSQCTTAELFLSQAMLAARPFLEPQGSEDVVHLDSGDDQYRSLFDQSDAAVLIVEDKIVVDCNAQVNTVFGVPAAKLVGNPVSALVPRDVYARICDRMEQRIAAALGGEAQEFEMTANLPDGRKRIVEMRMLPLDLPAGKRVIQVISRDCSERRQMEEALRSSEARYRELFETLSDGIVIFDEQIRLVDCNRALLEMLGYDRLDKLRVVRGLDLIPLEYHELVRMALRGLDGGGYKEYETECLTHSGERVLVLVRIWGRRDAQGQMVGGWAVIRNITDERRMENQVAHIEKFRLLGELAAAISHEIRNPLTTVRGFAQFLASRPECTLADKEIYQLMLSEVDSATTIIRDFLDMARPTGAKRERFSLSDLLQSLGRVLESQALLQRVQIRMVISPDLRIIGDPGQIRQVFVNLAQNALQAMPEGGELTLSAEIAGCEGLVRVRDTGIGISPANLERIGRPFFTTRSGGTGLGLTTCFRIVRAHGGSIQVQSELGRGTEFAVRLPARLE